MLKLNDEADKTFEEYQKLEAIAQQYPKMRKRVDLLQSKLD